MSDYVPGWDYKRAMRAEEWTERYLLGECGPVTVIPGWRVERERRANRPLRTPARPIGAGDSGRLPE